MRSEDSDNRKLVQVAPGMWVVKDAYKGKYVFGAPPPIGLRPETSKISMRDRLRNWWRKFRKLDCPKFPQDIE
jgi:hypothetical protein